MAHGPGVAEVLKSCQTLDARCMRFDNFEDLSYALGLRAKGAGLRPQQRKSRLARLKRFARYTHGRVDADHLPQDQLVELCAENGLDTDTLEAVEHLPAAEAVRLLKSKLSGNADWMQVGV